MREGVVNAAAVDIKILTKVLHGYAGAFNVPAGIANAPGGVPLERLILELGLCKPQDEVVLVALVYVLLNALAHADIEIIGIEVVEDVVALKLGGVKIHIAAGKVGIAGIHELGDYFNVLIDAVCRGLNYVGGLDVELSAVGKERIGIELCDLHNGFVLALCALEHLILALVGIACEVSDIGDVHDAFDVITGIAQVLFKHVLHYVRAQIADMRKVIHRGAAGVHLDYVGVIGDKVLFFSACRVIKLHIYSPSRSGAVLEHADVFYKVFNAGVQSGCKDQHPADDRDYAGGGEPRLRCDDEYAEGYHCNAGLDFTRPRGGYDNALLDGQKPQTRNTELAHP